MSDTRPAPDTPEELIWLRGYEAGVIQCRTDQAKASEAIQDARRSSIQSLIQKGIERDEEMRALQARYDKLEAAARDACEQLKSLAYASHKATGRPLSKRPRTKLLQRPEKVRDNLLAVRKVLRSVVDGGE